MPTPTTTWGTGDYVSNQEASLRGLERLKDRAAVKRVVRRRCRKNWRLHLEGYAENLQSSICVILLIIVTVNWMCSRNILWLKAFLLSVFFAIIELVIRFTHSWQPELHQRENGREFRSQLSLRNIVWLDIRLTRGWRRQKVVKLECNYIQPNMLWKKNLFGGLAFEPFL